MKIAKSLRNAIIAITIIFVGIVAFCIVKIGQKNNTYIYGEGNVAVEPGSAVSQIVVEHVKLPKGIYEVSVPFSTEGDEEYRIKVDDGTVYAGGLRANGIALYQGYTDAKFNVWLFEDTEELVVYVEATQALNPVVLGQATFRETNLLWIYIIVVSMMVYAVLIILSVVFDRIRAGKISKENIVVGLMLLVTAILSSVFFMCGNLRAGADLGVHLERIEGVVRSIKDGVFPVRLESNYPFEYGYASGLFYCDIFLYIPAVLRLAGFTVQGAYNMFGILCMCISVVLTWYCMYKMFGNKYIAVLGSAAYNIAMYHIHDTILRGGTGSLTADIFMPLLVYGYYRFFSEDSKSKKYKTTWIPITIGYTGIVCSHILTLELSVFWTIIIFMVMIKKVFDKYRLLELLKAFIATVLLNLWFIVPFFDYYVNEDIVIKNVSARQIQQQGMSYFHYLRAPFDVTFDGGMSFFGVQVIGTLLLVIVVLFIVFWIAGFWKSINEPIMTAAKMFSIFTIVCVVLSLNVFPWNFLHGSNKLFEKLISALQFPVRFIGYADVFVAIVLCAMVYGLGKNGKTILRNIMLFTSVLCILLYGVFLTEKMQVEAETNRYVYDNTQIIGYLAGAEYLIYGTDLTQLHPWIEPRVSEGIGYADYKKGDLKAEVYIENSTGTEGYVEFPLLHYKGYEANASDGTELECIKGTNNVIRVIIPADFNDSIKVDFHSPVIWRITEVISLLCWIGLLVFAIIYKKRRAV